MRDWILNNSVNGAYNRLSEVALCVAAAGLGALIFMPVIVAQFVGVAGIIGVSSAASYRGGVSVRGAGADLHHVAGHEALRPAPPIVSVVENLAPALVADDLVEVHSDVAAGIFGFIDHNHYNGYYSGESEGELTPVPLAHSSLHTEVGQAYVRGCLDACAHPTARLAEDLIQELSASEGATHHA